MRTIWTLIASAVTAQEWAGSGACAVCHAEIARSYPKTPMALSSGRVGTGLIAESFGKAAFTHERTGYSYRAFRDGPKLLFEFGKPGGRQRSRKLSVFFFGVGTYSWDAEKFQRFKLGRFRRDERIIVIEPPRLASLRAASVNGTGVHR